ncbi:LysR family transcriptional regulator [Sporosarcina cyprini]|uniref:LysR family transcriptional regulator n=1 Tax=Sporosarcina cyprini TaxID=2910523 RepID=UPI001EE13BE0|nr:LysR family transcriptional regulator [Sporosarcina cyprini]MCG3088922.1 LysR family transcriptional regulator [Sporosarcina cyprini]
MKDLHTNYLKAIAEHGSISQAAKALYISQPYLSKYIKTLEEELGVEVLNRQVTPMELTYAGERYIHYMNDVEDTIQTMLNELQGISNLKRGRLRIGISPILATYTLDKFLPHFMKRYEGIEIELIEESAAALESLLLQNKIDVCVTSLPITNQEIQYEFLYEEYNYIVIPSNHPLYEETPPEELNLSNLDGQKFILAKPGMGLRRFTDTVFAHYNIRPQIVLETLNVENALRLANKGIAITIVPQSVIECVVLTDKANLYPLKNPEFKSHIVVSYQKNARLSPASLAFIEMAKKETS